MAEELENAINQSFTRLEIIIYVLFVTKKLKKVMLTDLVKAVLKLEKLPVVNSLAAGLWYIHTLISALITAVFGCLTNALAPPPIALESCSTAQMDQPA